MVASGFLRIGASTDLLSPFARDTSELSVLGFWASTGHRDLAEQD